MSQEPVLDFGRGRIRPWRRGDRAALLRHADDPLVARYLSLRFPHPYRPEDADAWFGFVEGQAPLSAFALDVEGEAVGGIGLRLGELEFAHSAELGYWLGRRHWRRGIVGAAVAAFVPWAAERFGLRRIAAYADVRNLGSVRVLERNGFAREGLLRCRAIRDGDPQDHLAFARLFPPAG
ncbi:GNAT family N-acetyltransferase [Coralloluteibacterium thermophilus]|uniref:GNAT family N-acetyltransferase n=1 Tax=Coralloluteibacterium thermophilum TaxID=2707049 RepID=A0ABV9NKD9_9GAMM